MNLALKLLAQRKLSVFLFHKVPNVVDPLIPFDLDLAGFNRVIDFIETQFRVIPLADAVTGMLVGKLPKNAACITFDDGYASWLTGAVPLLEKRSLHATFFITSGQLNGEPMWHERVAAAVANLPGSVFYIPGLGLPLLPIHTIDERRLALTYIEQFLKYQRLDVRDRLISQIESLAGVAKSQVSCMTVSQLRDLHSRGFGIGAHTIEHPILSVCDGETASHEIGAVREQLEGIIGGQVRSFAYPNGRAGVDFGADHVRMVQAAGYTHAVTTQWGSASIHTSVYEIPRFTPWGPSSVRMALQTARNLIRRPTLTSASKVDSSTSVGVSPAVLYVENGAGFGGAIVALQTLVTNTPPANSVCHVVTNMEIGQFAKIANVKSSCVITDRYVDFRSIANRIRAAQLGSIERSLLFALGRLDDLVNRLPYLFKLWKYALRLKPSIIHGNNEPSSNREAMLVAKLLRIPYVQHLRGALAESSRSSQLLSWPSMFIPVSRWLAGELLVSGVPADRIRQVYDAVDIKRGVHSIARASLREEFGLDQDVVLVAMIGMLVDWKGQDLFIDAISRLHRLEKKVAFLIIGGAPERGDPEYLVKLQTQAAALNGAHKIYFLGQRSDIQTILPQINIAVSASTEPEPLGLVMLEAMLLGCLFIAPAFGAATEVIVDGVNGFLFQPKNSTSLAEKLSFTINSADKSIAWTSAAKALISKQFDIARCVDETTRVHDICLICTDD